MKPPIHWTKKRRKFSPFLFSPFFVNKSTLEVKISLWKDVIYKNVKSRCTKETKKKKNPCSHFFFFPSPILSASLQPAVRCTRVPRNCAAPSLPIYKSAYPDLTLGVCVSEQNTTRAINRAKNKSQW